jgi:hypothetical protein
MVPPPPTTITLVFALEGDIVLYFEDDVVRKRLLSFHGITQASGQAVPNMYIGKQTRHRKHEIIPR